MTDEQHGSLLCAIRSAYEGGYYRAGAFNTFEISRDIGFLLSAFDAAVSCKDDYRAKLIRALNGHTDEPANRIKPAEEIAASDIPKNAEKTMLRIAHWLICGKYRTLMHRHDGYYRATDRGVIPPQEWNAETLAELVGLIWGEIKGIKIP